ncbi:MAG: site-specific DNA-methyltransferase [Candidatus Rokubacteria bacterium]|nr:site-specific DNA-methyltransferase [Candidatus Rokubacteria bacterium]
MTRYESGDGRVVIWEGDSRRLDAVPTASVGAIVTSPPYWVRGRGRASADRYARSLAMAFAREWRRVLARDGDLWLIIGDRHDGAEWIGLDGFVVGWFRRTGWRLQSRGFWAQSRSRERWDNRVNYLLRFRTAEGRPVRPDSRTLAWTLPLPVSHRESRWDATPEPLIRAALEAGRKRGVVLDPFAGAGTVGLVAAAMGRRFIGVELDRRMARLAARRLRLHRARP